MSYGLYLYNDNRLNGARKVLRTDEVKTTNATIAHTFYSRFWIQTRSTLRCAQLTHSRYHAFWHGNELN
jgi:hypothetical protein